MEEKNLYLLRMFWQTLTSSNLPAEIKSEDSAQFGSVVEFTIPAVTTLLPFFDEVTYRCDVRHDDDGSSTLHIRGWMRRPDHGASIYHCDWRTRDAGVTWERA